jgi:hypothetical protein
MKAYQPTPTPQATLLLTHQANIEAKLDQLGAIIDKARRGAMGLTLDEDKTLEWHSAKRAYNTAFNMLRDTNSKLNKLRKAYHFEAINGKRVTIYKYLVV